MERFEKDLVTSTRVLQKLQELATRNVGTLSEMDRDAMIKRFEFCFELVWKTAKDYLWEIEGIEAASPKKVIRVCREQALLTTEEAMFALQMTDDRNLTAHTYDEIFAQAMAACIKNYANLLEAWLSLLSRSY